MKKPAKPPTKKSAVKAGIVRTMANLTAEYAEILNILCERERYQSPTEAFESFLAHYALAPQPHRLTGTWAVKKGFEREERGRQLLALLKSGQSKKGSWLKARIYECIVELLGPDAKTPRIDEVLAKLSGAVESKLEKEFS